MQANSSFCCFFFFLFFSPGLYFSGNPTRWKINKSKTKVTDYVVSQTHNTNVVVLGLACQQRTKTSFPTTAAAAAPLFSVSSLQVQSCAIMVSSTWSFDSHTSASRLSLWFDSKTDVHVANEQQKRKKQLPHRVRRRLPHLAQCSSSYFDALCVFQFVCSVTFYSCFSYCALKN